MVKYTTNQLLAICKDKLEEEGRFKDAQVVFRLYTPVVHFVLPPTAKLTEKEKEWLVYHDRQAWNRKVARGILADFVRQPLIHVAWTACGYPVRSVVTENGTVDSYKEAMVLHTLHRDANYETKDGKVYVYQLPPGKIADTASTIPDLVNCKKCKKRSVYKRMKDRAKITGTY